MGLLNILTGGKSGQALNALNKGIQAIQGVPVPDIASQMIELQKLVSAGELSPEDAQAIAQQSSALGNYSSDPRLKQAQLAALDQLMRTGTEGGLTVQDQASMQAANAQEDARSRGAREAILQNMAARGMGNSGLNALSQMQNQQGEATRNSLTGLQTAAMARQRQLEALMQGGQLSGQMEAQNFGEAAQKAQAQDIINRFNAANQTNANFQNTAAHNAAQAANLANRQGIMNQNTAMSNQQQMYNKQLAQQRFQNQMQKAGGIQGGYNNLAQAYTQQGGQVLGLLGGGLSAGGAALGGYLSRPQAPGGVPMPSTLGPMTADNYDPYYQGGH